MREAIRPLRRLLAELWRHGPAGDPEAGGGSDDVSHLPEAFGRLVRALDAALGQVTELNEALKRRVEERTAERVRRHAGPVPPGSRMVS